MPLVLVWSVPFLRDHRLVFNPILSGSGTPGHRWRLCGRSSGLVSSVMPPPVLRVRLLRVRLRARMRGVAACVLRSPAWLSLRICARSADSRIPGCCKLAREGSADESVGDLPVCDSYVLAAPTMHGSAVASGLSGVPSRRLAVFVLCGPLGCVLCVCQLKR